MYKLLGVVCVYFDSVVMIGTTTCLLGLTDSVVIVVGVVNVIMLDNDVLSVVDSHGYLCSISL